MKRRRKNVLLLLVVVATVILIAVFLEMVVLERRIGPSKEGARKIISNFTFADADSLIRWDQKVLGRRKTNYKLGREFGKSCIVADSKNSASAFYLEQKLSHKRRPFISWEWVVKKFPLRKNREALNRKKEFDFGAQVYVIFVSRFFLNTKAIQYVWTETIPAGTVSFSAYTRNVKILVLESGKSETWKKEERDIKADYKRLFGKELEKDIRAVAVMADSDSTGSEAAACFTNILLGYINEPAETVPREKGTWWEALKLKFSRFLNERSSH